MTASTIVWFRRDLRVHDHPALAAARAAGPVACVFVVEPAMLRASPARAAFLVSALDSLRAELAARGAPLIVAAGPAERALPTIARAVGAGSINATADVTPRSHERERALAKASSIPLELHDGIGIHPPGSIVNNAGDPYKIFTPYFRRWQAREPRAITPTPRALDGIAHPSDRVAERALRASAGPVARGFPADERTATRALRRFVRERIEGYRDGRHALDGAGSSHLSPAFRFGLLSPVLAMASAPAGKAGAEWIRQLAWRDFAYETVAATPRLLTSSLRRPAAGWRRAPAVAERWRDGTTGEPVIDAAMRQLANDGWISNRARMTVGSWLVRDQGIDWRVGASHFMRTLLDGDPAVNAFNWQWVAGTGWDAPAPFWRLAPMRQGQRYDAEGTWVRRWAS